MASTKLRKEDSVEITHGFVKWALPNVYAVINEYRNSVLVRRFVDKPGKYNITPPETTLH